MLQARRRRSFKNPCSLLFKPFFQFAAPDVLLICRLAGISDICIAATGQSRMLAILRVHALPLPFFDSIALRIDQDLPLSKLSSYVDIHYRSKSIDAFWVEP
jgi:hypothetical protein